MTLKTLIGRLRRLHTLAELVHADDYTQKLHEVLTELEHLPEDQAEVDPVLLQSLRHRILTRPE